MNFLTAASKAVFRVEKIVIGILVALMTLSIIFGVIFRYFLNTPLMWSDEISMFSFIWMSFIGGSMALYSAQFAEVSIITDRLKEKHAAILIWIGTIIVFAFCLCIFVISVKWITSPTITLQRSTAMQLPMIFPYLSVPVGMGFMSLHALEIIFKTFKNIGKPVSDKEGAQWD